MADSFLMSKSCNSLKLHTKDERLKDKQLKDKQLLILFFIFSALLCFNLMFLFFNKSSNFISFLPDLTSYSYITKYSCLQDDSRKPEPLLSAGQQAQVKQERGEPKNPRLSFFLNQPMDINLATSTELELINGIGPRTAERIIKYRNQFGKFKNINELENIHGIGPGTIRKISGYVSFPR